MLLALRLLYEGSNLTGRTTHTVYASRRNKIKATERKKIYASFRNKIKET